MLFLAHGWVSRKHVSEAPLHDYLWFDVFHKGEPFTRLSARNEVIHVHYCDMMLWLLA